MSVFAGKKKLFGNHCARARRQRASLHQVVYYEEGEACRWTWLRRVAKSTRRTRHTSSFVSVLFLALSHPPSRSSICLPLARLPRRLLFLVWLYSALARKRRRLLLLSPVITEPAAVHVPCSRAIDKVILITESSFTLISDRYNYKPSACSLNINIHFPKTFFVWHDIITIGGSSSSSLTFHS